MGLSVMRWARPLLLLIVYLAPLTAQAGVDNRFLDTLQVSLDRATSVGTLPPRDICNGKSKPTKTLCENLIVLRRSEIDLLVQCHVKCPQGWNSIAEVPVFAAWFTTGSPLNLLLRSEPRSGRAWQALALYLAKSGKMDSSTKLLTQARTMGDVSPGFVDLTASSILFGGDRVDEAWAALVRAATDTSALVHQMIRNRIEPLLPLHAMITWDSLPGDQRSAWLTSAPLVQRLVREGLIPRWRDKYLPLLRAYALDRDGPRLVLGVGLPVYINYAQAGSTAFRAIRLVLVAIREQDGREFVLDTLRQFVGSKPPIVKINVQNLFYDADPGPMRVGRKFVSIGGEQTVAGSWLPLVQEIELPPGRYMIRATYLGGDFIPAEFILRSYVVPEPTESTLSLGDLVLGLKGGGSIWNSGTQPVPVNPMGAWQSESIATLYAQLRNLTPGQIYSVTLELFEVEDSKSDVAEPKLTLKLDEVAKSKTVEWYRELELGRLKTGEYRVKLTLRSGGIVVTTSDRMVVVP